MTVRLRELEDKDRTQIAFLLNNRKIWDQLRDLVPHPYTTFHAREFIDRCKEEDPKVTFGIEYQGELCGIIGLTPQSDVFRVSAEIGYWIGEPYWGKGIATEAIKEIVKYAFDRFELERIYAGVFANNKGSQRALEKAGFKLEGIFRNAVIKNGEVMDDHQYAILKEDIFNSL